MPPLELVEAAKAGNLAKVKALLQSGAPIEARDDGLAPLHHAARCGHREVVKALLYRGAQVNAPVFTSRTVAQGRTPAIEAASHGQLATLRCLAEHGAVLHDPGSVGIDAVMAAATGGNVAVMQYLVEEKALPCDEIGKDGFTPLYKAVEKADLSIASYLLERGANPDKPGKGTPSPVESVRQRLRWARLTDAEKANLRGILEAMQRRPAAHPAPIIAPGPPGSEDVRLPRRLFAAQQSSGAQLTVIPMKTIGRTGDAFVDSCFAFDLVEYDETRDWSEIAEAVSLAEQGNEAIFSGQAGRMQEVIRSCNGLKTRYPDFDFCYTWLSRFYLHLDNYGEAHKAVTDGLRLARSKFRLCEKMAKIHLKTGELEDAVRWWVRALVRRVSARKLDDVVTLIHLSYVAEALELPTECRALRQVADRIRSDGIRLASAAANNLYSLSRAWGSPSMKRSITMFLEEYIYPEAKTRLEELRRLAPKGIYCKHCSTRYGGEELTWYKVGASGEPCVFYSCPKCRCNLSYH